MSVKCPRCKLFNSFSFSTNQTTCIKCNTRLDENDVAASKMHLANLNTRNFNNTWNNTEDSYTITNTNVND